MAAAQWQRRSTPPGLTDGDLWQLVDSKLCDESTKAKGQVARLFAENPRASGCDHAFGRGAVLARLVATINTRRGSHPR